jgi:hypothetical protein
LRTVPETVMLMCMRTTIDVPDPLHRELRLRAVAEGTTLREIVEKALRSYLAPVPGGTGYALHWRTERGRLQPGVSLEDRDALFDLMDGRR